MGNQVHHRSPSTTGSLIAGSSNNNSNEVGFSDSSAGNSGFSARVTIDDDTFPKGEILTTPNLKIFSFGDLKKATRNFRDDTVLGGGGFGTVYKGWIDGKIGNGGAVAIKKLNTNSLQGLEEWLSEVNFLGRLSHPNLVKLLGYCFEGKELMLVYEFMQRGSLENHLFPGSSTVQQLSWDVRLKISIGAARGLVFLHSAETKIIYRDFKPSNILLDWNYNAKLSDFGLAKDGPFERESHVTTRVMGTYGYVAPEYMATGHLYVKSDVYGFGVVLLEMLTGQRALDRNRPVGQHNLVGWLKPSLSDRKKLECFMDPKLEGRYPSKGAFQVAKLILKCLRYEPQSRPSMNEVLVALEQIESLKGKSREFRASSTHATGLHSHSQQLVRHESQLHPNHKRNNIISLPLLRRQKQDNLVNDGGMEVDNGRPIRSSSKWFGEPAILFHEEDVVAGASKYSFALVAKFFRSYHGERSFRPDIELIKKAVARWKLSRSCEVITVDDKHVLLNFAAQTDMISIWLKEIIEVAGFTMRVFRWTPFFRPSDKDPSVVPGWILFPNLPFFCYEENNLKAIASVVGEVLAIDQATRKGTMLNGAKVCVLMDLLKDYPKRVWIGCGVNGFWQAIDYASVPDYCKLCSKFGHKGDNCIFTGKEVVNSSIVPDSLQKQKWKQKEKLLVINETTDVQVNIEMPVESVKLKMLEVPRKEENNVDLGQTSVDDLDSTDVVSLPNDVVASGVAKNRSCSVKDCLIRFLRKKMCCSGK